jgi:peptidoglycan/LPS O-acetylase OafA/YrhL/lysophospholipase L1-like esterase
MDQPTRYQPEIDGLRAVAITPVVLFHAGVPGLRGGYVGVDVFFVLSGYLISRLLLIELRQTGTIDFAGFYARRVRRLLPALAVVVAAALLLGIFILSPALERPELSKSAIATMAFVSNIYFWSIEAIYFAPPTDWIPLLNMWTLSAEEQFYLLWPALMLLAAWLGRRSGRPMAAIATGMIFAAAVISFTLFWRLMPSRPTAAFYLTPTRGWEFALGGLLALTGDHTKRMGRVGGPAALLGLIAIALAVTLPHHGLVSRVVTAALGTAAVIAGITAAPAAVPVRLLQLGPLTAVGKLSYSWYLWHWPLLAFARLLAPGDNSLVRAIAVVFAALALAAVTFVFIENPIRQRRPWPFSATRQTLLAGGALSVTVAALAVTLGLTADAATRRDPWLTAIVAAARTIPAKPGCNFAQSFTELAPAADCAIGGANGPLRILVWGDSQAEQLKAMMRADGDRGSYSSAIWSKSDCPPLVGAPSEESNPAACFAFNRSVAAELPALAQAGLGGLILASRRFGFPGAWAPFDRLEAWRAGMQQIFATARGLNIRVLVMAPIPQFPLALPECLAHGSAVQCGVSRAMMERERAPLLAALREIAQDYDNVRIWDPFDLLCDASTCTAMRDGTIMYSDRGHLSVLGARKLAPIVAPQLDWLRAQQ